MALRDAREGTVYDRTIDEYLVNPLQHELRDVVVRTGGWYGDPDAGVAHSNDSVSRAAVVPAQGHVLLVTSTQDEFDEFVVSWSLEYRDPNGELVAMSFSTWKSLRDAHYVRHVPILGGPGSIIPRSGSE